MRIAILTFDGWNEIDSFVACNIINRVKRPGWKAEITCPTESVVSGNGVRVMAQQPLEFANQADAVLVGSGRRTAEVAADAALMGRLRLDPGRQLIGSQCSGALVLERLGLLGGQPVCADRTTQPALVAAGLRVLERPFFCAGNVATAGGCLSAPYLATWVLWRLADRATAEEALAYVAPVGEEADYIGRAIRTVGASLSLDAPMVATTGPAGPSS